MKLEEPREILFDPLLQVFFELHLGQQEYGALGSCPRDSQGAFVEVCDPRTRPRQERLGTRDGDGRPIHDSHPGILIRESARRSGKRRPIVPAQTRPTPLAHCRHLGLPCNSSVMMTTTEVRECAL